MGAHRPRPLVFDAGAFIAFERNDRKIVTLVEMAVMKRAPVHTPTVVIAQVWRDGARQARLSRLVASGALHIHAIELEDAQGIGVICGRSQTTDVVDASVVLLARRERASIVTSDPSDLRRLDSSVTLVEC